MFYSQLFVTPNYPTSSFEGQTVIITGSNTGLGKEAARHIARLGVSKLILAVRNVKAGQVAKEDIESTTNINTTVIEVWKLDLSTYQSVKEFAQRVATLPRLDVLVENAGVAPNTFRLAEGYENTITVNVISTFLLALLCLPKLKATAKQFSVRPRLVIVSSETHSMSKLTEKKAPNIFEAMNNSKKFSGFNRYPTSKLLEILAFRQIAPKIDGGVIFNILNPGMCHSELSRDQGSFASVVKFLVARTTEVGSRTLVAAAAAGPESHGKYMTDGKVNDSALSSFVRGREGVEVQRRVWNELRDILEKISPGITDNL